MRANLFDSVETEASVLTEPIEVYSHVTGK
jgi:hypothetical protein